MNFALFMLFGMLEIYALFALMFKTFRLPYIEYIKEISVIALTVALVSYIIRIYFELNMFIDIVLHLVLYILFFRYLIRAKIWRAVVISFMYIGYGILSTLSYFGLTALGVVSSEQLTSSAVSLSAYYVQMATIVLSFGIAYLIYATNSGFSFIVRPPHDFRVKKKLGKSDLIVLVSVIAGFILVFGVTYAIYHYDSFIAIPLAILPYIILVYMAYRRDLK